MISSPKNRIGCWFSALLERKGKQNASLAAQFGSRAQSALDKAETPPAAKTRGALTREGLTLVDLQPGECGYVSRLVGTTQGRLRLLEMGMTPGTHVQVTRTAAFGGPLDVLVRGYQLSLRRDEAAAVWLGGLLGTEPDMDADVLSASPAVLNAVSMTVREQDDLG